MPTGHEDASAPDSEDALQTLLAELEQGSADVPVLKKLARLCTQNPVHEEPRSPASPAFSVPLTPSPVDGSARQLSSSDSEFWLRDKLFDRLFNTLLRVLDPRKVSLHHCHRDGTLRCIRSRADLRFTLVLMHSIRALMSWNMA